MKSFYRQEMRASEGDVFVDWMRLAIVTLSTPIRIDLCNPFLSSRTTLKQLNAILIDTAIASLIRRNKD